MKALVVDDEELARRNVTVLLRNDPDVESIVECESGAEAIETIRRWQPDLVFLDVQMPGKTGLEVVTEVGSAAMPATIFVTAYDEYALRAFEAGALDYLMKPFDDARFRRALHRAKERLGHRGTVETSQPKRLAVKTPGRLLFVNVADVDWVEAANYYACLHVGKETHIIRRTLAELEGDLGEEAFIRIHRSIIVNVDRIQGLELQSGGEYEVVLKSKARLKLSRRYRKRLQERMQGRVETARAR